MSSAKETSIVAARRSRRPIVAVVLTIAAIAVSIVFIFAAYRLTPFGRYNATIIAGRRANPFIIQMETLWPDSQHSISYSTGQYGTPTWNSRIGLGGRYVLTMQMPIKMEGLLASAEFGVPVFYLWEVKSITQLPTGQIEIEHGESKTFDTDGWQRLHESGGDLSSVGIVPNRQPIPDFQNAWRTF